MELVEAIILSVLAASTPLLIAATGELVTERAGVLNLGVEGMMIVGAACGFGGAWLSGSTIIGALCGIIAGMLLSLVFAMMTLGLAVNQVASGLALTILGIGLSGLIGAGFVGERITPAPHLHIPGLTDIPLIGRILFGEDPFIYLSLALVVAVWGFLYRTRPGLVLRACGDNHVSAHALGYPVLRIRTLAVMFGGACAGLAGAYLPLAYTPFFIPGMTAGRGWIALALVVFAAWLPVRVVIGALPRLLPSNTRISSLLTSSRIMTRSRSTDQFSPRNDSKVSSLAAVVHSRTNRATEVGSESVPAWSSLTAASPCGPCAS